jgi:catechol 2,3-dioxygenase-like lactoylglutathione lyase family enzyme
MHFSPLVPELYVSDLARSLDFYCGLLGFSVLYDRPEERFAYLDREGAQLMLEQPTGRAWVSGPIERPFGRGVNFEIGVSDAARLYGDCLAAEASIFLALEETWYRRGTAEVGNRQFIVSDPDGYLLRFAEDLGERPLKAL